MRTIYACRNKACREYRCDAGGQAKPCQACGWMTTLARIITSVLDHTPSVLDHTPTGRRVATGEVYSEGRRIA